MNSVPVAVGCRVQVWPSVSNPKFGWGPVTHSSVGTVTDVSGSLITVYFQEQSGWLGHLGEVCVVSASFADFSAGEESVYCPLIFMRGVKTVIDKCNKVHQCNHSNVELQEK
jgi:hypothetical protein